MSSRLLPSLGGATTWLTAFSTHSYHSTLGHTKSMTLIIAHHKIYPSHYRHPELNDSMRVKLRQHSQSINSYGKFPQLHTPSIHYKVLIYARRIDQCTIQISYYLICTHLCTMVQGVRKRRRSRHGNRRKLSSVRLMSNSCHVLTTDFHVT